MKEKDEVWRGGFSGGRRHRVSTFPINNEIISSEIRRVMPAVKIDPRSGYAQVRQDRGAHVYVDERTLERMIYR